MARFTSPYPQSIAPVPLRFPVAQIIVTLCSAPETNFTIVSKEQDCHWVPHVGCTLEI